VSQFPALATNTLQTVGLQETHRSKAKGSGTAATDGVPRHAGAQAPQKEFAIDAMFATGIVHRMEAGNRTTDAAHVKFQKHPDRLWRSGHHIVDQVRRPNGHGISSREVSIVPLAAASLSPDKPEQSKRFIHAAKEAETIRLRRARRLLSGGSIFGSAPLGDRVHPIHAAGTASDLVA
jgi:hypothetical protein